MKNSRHLRDLMITTQLENRGITNRAVLTAMREVPREFFVPPSLQ